MRTLVATALAIGACALLGCSSGIDQHGCTSDRDCDSSQVCLPQTGLCGVPTSAPEAPGNLHATIAFEQVVLTWDPAKGASSYEVYLAVIDDLDARPGSPSFAGVERGTTFATPAPSTSHFALFVRSVGAGGFSDLSSPAVVERIDDALAPTNITASGGSHHLVVRWDPPASSLEAATHYTVVAADQSGGPYQPIATTTETSWDDAGPPPGLAPLTTRHYLVRAYSTHFAGPVSAEVSGTTLPLPDAPGQLAARRVAPTTMALSWAPAARAVAYDVALDGTPIDPARWQLSDQNRSAPAFVDFSFPTDGLSHTYAVRTVASDDVGPFSAPITVLAVPPGPPALTAEAGEMRIQLRWAQVPTADSYVVARGSDPDTATPVAEVAIPSYLDVSPLATSQTYWVRSKNAGGVSLAAGVQATPFPDPDQANPGADPLDTTPLDEAHSPAQTFVIGTGGLLEGIELATSCSVAAGCATATVEIDSGGIPIASASPVFSTDPFPCCGPTALAPGFHGRSYFAFGDGLPVSAGERLRVVVDSPSPMLAGTTFDLYAGGTLEEGRPVLDRDLVFRTEVLPATGQLTQPGKPRLVFGVGQVELLWAPSPLATSYAVLRSNDGSNFSPVGTTADASFVDAPVAPGPVFYQVQAIGPSGPTRLSAIATGTLPGWAIAASNVGVTAAASAADDLSQTFTAATSGEVFRVELALGAAPGGTATRGAFAVDVLDAAGTVLGTSFPNIVRVASCCGVPPDLSAGGFGTAFVDFFPAIAVSAGQQLELRLRPQTPLVAGVSSDAYTGGTLKVAGVADPARDLAFKVLVQ